MFKRLMHIFVKASEDNTNPKHYRTLKRNLVGIMLVITIAPLSVVVLINNFQLTSYIKDEIKTPLYSLITRTKNSFELFLDGRLSTLRFISTAYTFDELHDEKNIKRVLNYLKKEFRGFVDLGLINPDGDLVSYAGPYELLGKNYSQQTSFQETLINGKYISNVFLGHRKSPHIVIAVQRLTEDGDSWILRATIDTNSFERFIRAMNIDPKSDAFLVDSKGVLQTKSKHYGDILERWPLAIPLTNYDPYVTDGYDHNGQKVVICSAAFSVADYFLIVIKPPSVVMRSWHALKSEMMIAYGVSVLLIVVVVFRLSSIIVRRIEGADRRREAALVKLQHSQKLSSIGRLAAGVAHEINNPLAIINEKAGLMNDLMEFADDFDNRTRFIELTSAIIASVARCRVITHRLLGFAKRIDVKIETLNINEIVNEVADFIEKEAMYKKIDIWLDLLDSLNVIASDRGQIQQVILNLLTNAVAAVAENGIITVLTTNTDAGGIEINVRDNGEGIPKAVMKKIFDPFFTTKNEKGTGLGLSITYGIVKKLGGSISVESDKKVGTTFSVRLPGSIAQHGGGVSEQD